MSWGETASDTFVARHDERDASDAERVLAQLEYGRERLERQLEVELGELAVVLELREDALRVARVALVVARHEGVGCGLGPAHQAILARPPASSGEFLGLRPNNSPLSVARVTGSR